MYLPLYPIFKAETGFEIEKVDLDLLESWSQWSWSVHYRNSGESSNFWVYKLGHVSSCDTMHTTMLQDRATS